MVILCLLNTLQHRTRRWVGWLMVVIYEGWGREGGVGEGGGGGGEGGGGEEEREEERE